MRCLIVSKTRARNAVCVGALAADRSNLRLTEQEGFPFLAHDTPYEIGQVWELSYDPCSDRVAPHLEDVLVTSAAFVEVRSDLAERLPEWVTSWPGGVKDLFSGKISGPTSSGSGYIQDDVPQQSVGFWIPDQDLVSEYETSPHNGIRRYYYRYEPFRIYYVGVARPPEQIQAGALVRVSLSRWYKPPDAADNFPERCYLQISGAY